MVTQKPIYRLEPLYALPLNVEDPSLLLWSPEPEAVFVVRFLFLKHEVMFLVPLQAMLCEIYAAPRH